MLRRFKQLLNPAQVFDLMSGGLQTGFVSVNSVFVYIYGGGGNIFIIFSRFIAVLPSPTLIFHILWSLITFMIFLLVFCGHL